MMIKKVSRLQHKLTKKNKKKTKSRKDKLFLPTLKVLRHQVSNSMRKKAKGVSQLIRSHNLLKNNNQARLTPQLKALIMLCQEGK